MRHMLWDYKNHSNIKEQKQMEIMRRWNIWKGNIHVNRKVKNTEAMKATKAM